MRKVNNMSKEYDYVIVGAGSSGCALAWRLSSDPSVQVALLESGPADKSAFIHMPRGLGVILNPGSKLIWEYDVSTGGNGPRERWYRGQTLGGSSSVNGMIYMRGAPMDYDGWAANGCTGWGWADVGKLFVEFEDHDQGANEWRGVGGPQRITTHPKGDALFEAILDAGTEMGIARVADVNALDAVREGGMGYQPTTRNGGKRASSAVSFLKVSEGRKNLHVLCETRALRIEFEDGANGQPHARSVRVRDTAGESSIKASREIIVSSGSMETPLLLQRSGIGDGNLLQSFGVETIVNAPGVGRNLRDHRHADLKLQVKGNSQNAALSGWRAPLSALQYFITKKGPMSHAAHEVGGFAKSDSSLDHADLQFGLMSLSSSTAPDGKIELAPYPGITFVTYFTRPTSEGEIRITSADPDAAPYVDVNHLSTEIDRERFIGAFRWNRRLAAQPALQKWVVQEVGETVALETDDDILSHAMAIGGTCFHTSGTARMGADEASVVDPSLRVRGVTGLRVADTSIMPTMVSGNTNGPAMMIGLKAGDLIQADWAK
jgi:choline dehydrogenase